MSARRRPAVPRERQQGLNAYDRLRESIIRGRLAPGSRLVEADLAAILGVSRTPVREAIGRLVQDGLAVPLRQSTRTQLAVTPLTQTDLHESYATMAALEGVAMRALRQLSAGDRRALAAALTRAEDTFERVGRGAPANFEQLFETHNAFHAVFIDRCAGRRLRGMIEQLRPHIHRYEYMYAPTVGPDYSATFAEHRAIIRAIRSGPPAAAEHAVRANWFNGAQRLSAAVGSLPLGVFGPEESDKP